MSNCRDDLTCGVLCDCWKDESAALDGGPIPQADGCDTGECAWEAAEPWAEDPLAFVDAILSEDPADLPWHPWDGTAILGAARDTVYQRQAAYGKPENSFTAIAAYWAAYLGHPIGDQDVAIMMILLKVARLKRGYHHDSVVDIAGYAECLGNLCKGDLK